MCKYMKTSYDSIQKQKSFFHGLLLGMPVFCIFKIQSFFVVLL